MVLAKDYNSVMARSEEIMKKTLGLDYSQFESGSIAFDYEGLMDAAASVYSLDDVLWRSCCVSGSDAGSEVHHRTGVL